VGKVCFILGRGRNQVSQEVCTQELWPLDATSLISTLPLYIPHFEVHDILSIYLVRTESKLVMSFVLWYW